MIGQHAVTNIGTLVLHGNCERENHVGKTSGHAELSNNTPNQEDMEGSMLSPCDLMKGKCSLHVTHSVPKEQSQNQKRLDHFLVPDTR